MLNRFFLLICVMCSFQLSYSQVVDSTSIVLSDSTVLSTPTLGKSVQKKKFFLRGILKEPYPSARKAALFSLILPGAGQAYNKRYWKIPFVYAGVGSLVYAVRWNGNQFRTFRQAYKYRVDGLDATVDPYVGVITDAGLQTWRDIHFKNYQLSYIGLAIVYILNGVEAYVDAHLLSFDVSDDLSLQLHPNTQIMHDGTTTFSVGFSLLEKNDAVSIHPGFVGLR